MSGDDSQQGAGAAQVEEGAAQQRQERRAVRGDQPHHSHGQRSQPPGPRLQPARPILAASRNESEVSDVASVFFQSLPRFFCAGSVRR